MANQGHLQCLYSKTMEKEDIKGRSRKFGVKKEAKRDFRNKMELDPELSWLTAQEEDIIKTTEQVKSLSGPMYLWDVAMINGISWDPSNKPLVEFVKSLVEGCEEVVPENEAMANKGHMQYIYSKTMEKEDITGRSRKLGVKKQAKITKEEHGQIIEEISKDQVAKRAKATTKAPTKAGPTIGKVPPSTGNGSSSSGEDDKTRWFAWANEHQTKLEEIINKAEEVRVVATANIESPWVAPKVLKEVEKVITMQKKTLTKLTSMKIIHTMSAPAVFSNKRFAVLKEEVDTAIKSESKHVATMRAIFVNQGIMADK